MKNTSFEAHEKIKPHKQTWHNRIEKVLLTDKGLTYSQIAQRLNCERGDVAKRMPEMVRKGKALESGVKQCPITMNNSTLYLKPIEPINTEKVQKYLREKQIKAWIKKGNDLGLKFTYQIPLDL